MKSLPTSKPPVASPANGLLRSLVMRRTCNAAPKVARRAQLYTFRMHRPRSLGVFKMEECHAYKQELPRPTLVLR
jgi:hypothetical protein